MRDMLRSMQIRRSGGELAMAEKIGVTINGKEISVQKGSYLLAAVKKAGFTVPTLCHRKDLTPTGTCRLCLCEIEVRSRKKLVTSCNYPVLERMEVWTESDQVVDHRRTLAEMYLGRWPNVPDTSQKPAVSPNPGSPANSQTRIPRPASSVDAASGLVVSSCWRESSILRDAESTVF